MRWDRIFLNFIINVFTNLGKPIFWLVYGLGIGLSSLIEGVLEGIKKIWFYIQVIGVMWGRFRLEKKKKIRKKFGWGRLTIVSLLIVLVGSFWWLVLKDLPKPQELLTRQQSLTTKIYDRNGILLYKLFKNQNRSIVSLTELPEKLISATLAIEDAEFYQHPGFSIRGIGRAARSNLGSSGLQGGSTITQQLVKNTLLTSERTIIRKLKEFVLAMEVEYFFTKDEILTMYLNEVGYGGTAYGIEEAANYYFGKSAKDLSLAEAALLAGLPASPTTYSPFGSRPDLAISRQHAVLKRMVEEGVISLDEAETAQVELLEFALPRNDILAPHFVMYVKEWLVNKYGEALVQTGGLEVITTLDYEIQKQAEAAVINELDKLKNMQVSNGSVIVTNPGTGEILAMVGSKDYFDTQVDGQVNVTLRPRQPGSSIKPLTYALALEKGLITVSTIIDDAPISYKTPGSPVYSPQNYDGRFHGRVTVRQALANSYNVPAVKVLAQVGVPQLVEFARLMGITTWTDSSRYGLALTLGGGEIIMRDMAEAYGAFANGGYRVPVTPLIQVNDFKGKIMDDFRCKACLSNRVISPETAYTISDILADNRARSAAFGLNSVLVIKDNKVAVKTGTTNDLRDNWTIGFTPSYLVATWVGNNDNSPMSRVASGITGASPIWQTIMKYLTSLPGRSDFIAPSNLIKVKICVTTQTLACTECPMVVEELFVSGTEPRRRCGAADFINDDGTSKSDKSEHRDKLLEGVTNRRD